MLAVKDNKAEIVELKAISGDTAYNCKKALSFCAHDFDRAVMFLKENTWDSHGFLVKRSKEEHE